MSYPSSNYANDEGTLITVPWKFDTINSISGDPIEFPDGILTLEPACVGSLCATNTTNQIELGATAGNTVIITSPAPAADRVYTLPDAGGNCSFVLTAGNQTIAGAKTLSSALTVSPVTNQLVLGTTNTTTINASAPAASRVYTLPDAGADCNFVLTAGSQTIAGAKTLSSALTITPVTNQLVLGTTNTVTLSAVAPAASRVYSFQDVGGAANVLLTEGSNTVNGAFTFSAVTNVSNATDSSASTNGCLILAGGLGVQKKLYVSNSGIFLENGAAGYTPSALNIYEGGSTHTTQWSGIWAAAQNGNITYTRIGNKVTLQLPDIQAAANAASVITNSTVLPAYLRPAGTVWFAIRMIDNGTSNLTACKIENTGTITIYGNAGGGNFAGAGNSGVWSCTLNYLV